MQITTLRGLGYVLEAARRRVNLGAGTRSACGARCCWCCFRACCWASAPSSGHLAHGVDAANAAYDRSLLGAIKAMDANISTESGGLGVELPYRMLEFFELTASGHVYYRVATEGGLVEIGNADLPPPARPLVTGRPQFSDAVYFGEPVRVGSYARVLDRPLAGHSAPQRVVIQVAETLESRQAFARTLLLQSIAPRPGC